MSYSQYIHFGGEEAMHGLCRPAHDWLVLVKRGIEQNRHAGLILEFFDQLPIKSIFFFANRL
jgi:hypothetical protein